MLQSLLVNPVATPLASVIVDPVGLPLRPSEQR